ncbi:DUF2264 domain-containing protein [Photobacterium sp. DNB23_23_1]
MKHAIFTNNPMQTKTDFQQLARDLFTPLLPYYREQGPRIDFDEGGACFDMVASSLEGVARPLWGVIPLTLGGGEFEHWPLIRELLIQGTEPSSETYWGVLGDVDQRSVEMAAIGLLLAVLPEQGWEPLTERQQDNLALWLASIQDKPTSHNNWLFFTIFVQQGLRKVGRTDLVDTKLEQHYLEKIKNWYLDDGWYGDGDIEAVDHYGGFAMHFYGLIYATLFEHKDPAYAELFIERANAFAEPFSYWFADNGDTLAQGRSLTYRFACCGFWAAYSVVGEATFTPGQIKGLWARHLRSWQHKPIFTHDGRLSRGYDYPNLHMCEVYNSPTSPYWAMKAFFPLMLPDDSDFWVCGEEPLAYRNSVVAMPANKTLVQRIDGNSIVHYGANIHPLFQLDKYNKFAYSTFGGMDINALLYSEKLSFGDNILALSFDQGANWQMRQKNLEVTVSSDELSIYWQSGEVKVLTVISVDGEEGFSRRHSFEFEREVWLAETGFAVGKWYQEEKVLRASGLQEAVIGAELCVQGCNGTSIIKSRDDHEKSAHLTTRVHTDVSFPRSAVPFLLTKLPAGKHTLESYYKMGKS